MTRKFLVPIHILIISACCFGFESVFKTRKVVNRSLLQCLDSNIEGRVYVLDCNGGNFQNWIFSRNLSIQNYATGLCLKWEFNNEAITAVACSTDTSHQWWVTPDNEIRNVATGQCLDAKGFQKDRMIGADCNEGNFQKWDEEIQRPVPAVTTTQLLSSSSDHSLPFEIPQIHGDDIANAHIKELEPLEVNKGWGQLNFDSLTGSEDDRHLQSPVKTTAAPHNSRVSLSPSGGGGGGDIVLGNKITNTQQEVKQVEVNKSWGQFNVDGGTRSEGEHSSPAKPTTYTSQASTLQSSPADNSGGDIVLGDKITNSNARFKKVEINNNKVSTTNYANGSFDKSISELGKEGDAYGIIVL